MIIEFCELVKNNIGQIFNDIHGVFYYTLESILSMYELIIKHADDFLNNLDTTSYSSQPKGFEFNMASFFESLWTYIYMCILDIRTYCIEHAFFFFN